jgi:putative salt-induced outer membrane protein
MQWLVVAATLFFATAAVQAQTNNAAASTNQAKSGAAPAQLKTNTPTNGWKTSISLGLTLARGNTDTTLLSATALTEKKWLQNALSFGADGLYGETRVSNQARETESAETLHGFSQYNRTFWGSDWNGLYAYGRIDGFHDGIADIKYRAVLGPGIGYYFITNKTADASSEIGAGYVKEQLGDNSESYATLRLTETAHYKIGPHAKAYEIVKLLPQVNQFENYLLLTELGIEAGLSKGDKLSLRSVLQDSYDNVPAADRLKNDLKLITSLVYKF